jgi:hypothetical protein
MSRQPFARRYWGKLTGGRTAQGAPAVGRERTGYTFWQRYWASLTMAHLPVKGSAAPSLAWELVPVPQGLAEVGHADDVVDFGSRVSLVPQRPSYRKALIAAAAAFAVIAVFGGAESVTTAVHAPASGPASLPSSNAGPPAGNVGSGSARPIDAVILADESASVDPGAVIGERRAATQIAQAEWSPQSQIAIYGFGSVPPGKPSGAAIDRYCGPTELTGSAARAKLAQCAAQIAPRSVARGSKTDFAAALAAAVAVLGERRSVKNRLPLVFLLTDGQLDVGPGSPYAGRSSSFTQANANAQEFIVSSILPELRRIGAEIWPVGFGQSDARELAEFAAGGAQDGCPAASGGAPRAVVISATVTGLAQTRDIQSVLISSFAAARCATAPESVWTPLGAGGSAQQTVTINPLATHSALVVDKGDPRVEVTYTDPLGHKVSDTSGPPSGLVDGSSYELTQSAQLPLETLRLGSPVPGQWQVTFTDPPGVPAQVVGLSTAWQGGVDLEFVGQIANPGHYQLTAWPVARSAPVPTSALGGLTAEFEVTLPDGQVTTLRSPLNASGYFAATVTVPGTLRGTAHVITTASAPGVQGRADADVPIQSGGGISVSLNVPPGTPVAPGSTITANAVVENTGLPATRIAFSLVGIGDGVDATLTQPLGPVSIPSGTSTIPLTISIGRHSRLGPALGTIRWTYVGQATSATADWLAVGFLSVNVQYPLPPFWLHWWFWIAVASVVAACAAAALLRRQYLVELRAVSALNDPTPSSGRLG